MSCPRQDPSSLFRREYIPHCQHSVVYESACGCRVESCGIHLLASGCLGSPRCPQNSSSCGSAVPRSRHGRAVLHHTHPPQSVHLPCGGTFAFPVWGGGAATVKEAALSDLVSSGCGYMHPFPLGTPWGRSSWGFRQSHTQLQQTLINWFPDWLNQCMCHQLSMNILVALFPHPSALLDFLLHVQGCVSLEL